MIKNYQNLEFKSLGVDLKNIDTNKLIAHFKENIQVCGINVLILIYYPPIVEKTAGGLIIPENLREQGLEYNSYTGVVLQLGPDAFQGKNFPSGPYIKEGDFVVFPRASSLQLRYEDEPFVIVEDFKIKMKIDDPSKVAR